MGPLQSTWWGGPQILTREEMEQRVRARLATCGGDLQAFSELSVCQRAGSVKA